MTLLTLSTVYDRVEAVRANSHDPEVAHTLEDTLHQDVLSAIASGSCESPRAFAEAALSTLEIKFPRWCA